MPELTSDVMATSMAGRLIAQRGSCALPMVARCCFRRRSPSRLTACCPDGASLRDLGVVRLRDLSTPEHIFQLLHPQLRADFPALRSLEGTPNNLTQQLNSFIGRERELAEIREMLASNRLVTLLGMGGIGKSRLSMQLAAEVLDDFPDGVWFVELAALTDPSSVPQAVASVLGVKEEAGRPVIEALTKYVRDLQVLVILDNCEQVIHGCADLAKRLLQAGAESKSFDVQSRLPAGRRRNDLSRADAVGAKPEGGDRSRPR